MKIIYIANVRIPTEKAHGIQIMKMSEAFSSAGSDLELVLPSRLNTKEFSLADPFAYYQVKEKFILKKIKCFDPVFLLQAKAGVYIKWQSFFFITSLFFYLLFKKDRKNHVFYARDGKLLPLLQLFSGRTVWEAHDLPKNANYYLPYWLKCWKIIAITERLKSDLIALGVGAEKIFVAPDGVDLAAFEKIKEDSSTLRKRLNLPLNEKIIMYSGHFYQWKGAQVLAEAAKHLSAGEIIVFIGGTEKDISAFKEKYGHIKNILILGHKPHQEVPHYLKAADVLILPNLGEEKISRNYTSPLKMFEYMAAQKPIIASDLLSIREILNSGNAILTPPNDAEALAQAITAVLKNGSFSDKITKQAFSDVLKFTWIKRAENIITFLKG